MRSETSVLNELAQLKKMNTVGVLLSAMDATADPAHLTALARLLPMQPVPELLAVRARLLTMATKDASADVRQPAWAAIATADQSLDAAWAAIPKTPAGLADLLNAIPLIFDPDIRSKAHDKVAPLLAPEMPADIVAVAKGTKAATGRYVRIELPHRGTLTLAEVQVFSQGRNIAPRRQGEAVEHAQGRRCATRHRRQDRRIVRQGRHDPHQGERQQSLVEVDLGMEYPIESIVIWNRTEGNGQYAAASTATRSKSSTPAARKRISRPTTPPPRKA